MEVRFVAHKDIDRPRWDGCVHYANNSLVYAYSWYLDNVSGEEWDALVEGDYESVMPLIPNHKIWGVPRLSQPLVCQQLGVFSINPLSPARIEAFLRAIPEKYKGVTIALNARNKPRLEKLPKGCTLTPQPNYVLYLNMPYEELRMGYSDNLKRNLKKAMEADFSVTNTVKPEVLVEMVRKWHGNKGTGIPEEAYHTALRVMYNAMHRGMAVASGVLSKEGELVAAAFFINARGRLVNLLNVSTNTGRESGAMHFLVDLMIRSFANSNIFLDFEGSNVTGVARFYESFGSVNQPYTIYNLDKTPIWVKALSSLKRKWRKSL